MNQLGNKEYPHSVLPSTKDRIKGNYYVYKNESCYWNGSRLINEKQRQYYEQYRKDNKEKLKERNKQYRKDNKEKIKEYKKKWRENNKDKIKERNKKKYENNKERYKERYKKYYVKKPKLILTEEEKRERNRRYAAKYRKNNKEKIAKKQKEYLKKRDKTYARNYYKNNEKHKKYCREYCKNNKNKFKEYKKIQYKNNPSFRLLNNLRSRLASTLRRQNAPKNNRTMDYTNCTVKFLYEYLEYQFTDGMNWKNMGTREDGTPGWDIDHRRPCASFDLNNEEEKYMCFHWTNLQPMWHEDNLRKSDEYDPKSFRYKWINKEIGWVGIKVYQS